MITELHDVHVSRELALLLKQAGFDWETKNWWDYCKPIDKWSLRNYPEAPVNWNSKYYNYDCSAPTLDVAQRWLREVKHLDISIHYDPTIKSQPYVYFIYDVEEKFNDILGIISPITHSYSDGYFYKYEEAQEAGIKKALGIILEKGE